MFLAGSGLPDLSPHAPTTRQFIGLNDVPQTTTTPPRTRLVSRHAIRTVVVHGLLQIMAQQELTEEQLAVVADRARVWQVRRFCQVLPSVVEYERGNETAHGTYSGSEPNGALAALLRCVIYRLGADLAMVSLLDDHNQYFISGASSHNIHDVEITMSEYSFSGLRRLHTFERCLIIQPQVQRDGMVANRSCTMVACASVPSPSKITPETWHSTKSSTWRTLCELRIFLSFQATSPIFDIMLEFR